MGKQLQIQKLCTNQSVGRTAAKALALTLYAVTGDPCSADVSLPLIICFILMSHVALCRNNMSVHLHVVVLYAHQNTKYPNNKSVSNILYVTIRFRPFTWSEYRVMLRQCLPFCSRLCDNLCAPLPHISWPAKLRLSKINFILNKLQNWMLIVTG